MFMLAAQFEWHRVLLNFKNGFVDAPLTEEVYVDQPEGFVKEGFENQVYRLERTLYGLR